MADWNEKMLDEELEAIMNDVPEQEDLEKKINQIINRRIRKVVMKTLCAIVSVILVAFLVISPLMNALFWNPSKMVNDEKLLTVWNDYFDMVYPWREVMFADVEKKGFARYDINMQVVDKTEPIHFGIQNVTCEVSRGNYQKIYDPGFMMTRVMGKFENSSVAENEKLIKSIEELPESAMIYLELSDSEAKRIEVLQNADINIEWIQVYLHGGEFQGGIRVENSIGRLEEGKRRSEMSGEELLEVYLKNLENLLEHPEVWSYFQLWNRSTVFMQSKEELQKTYEKAKELTEVTTKNYCISGQRDEVLEYLNANKFDDIRIEEVKLSIYE